MNKKKLLMIGLLLVVLCTSTFLFMHSENNYYYFFALPKCCHFQADNKELYFFGSLHSINPKDSMFSCLEKQMNDFKPDLVLVEGGYNKHIYSREESYSYGESAFAASIATEKEILVEDIEPPYEKQIQYLMQSYNVEDILSMYIIRQIGSYEILPDENTEETTKENMQDTILNGTNELIEAGLPYSYNSIEDILAILNTHLHEDINEDNWLSLNCNGIYALGKGKGLIHDIYVDVYNYRNIYLVELIKEKKMIYNRIFIVMGNQHMFDTKKELQELY